MRTSVPIAPTVFCLSAILPTLQRALPAEARNYHQQLDPVTRTQQARWRWKYKPCDINYLQLSVIYMNDHFRHQRALKSARTTCIVCFMEKKNINWLVFVMQMECVFWEVLGNCSIMNFKLMVPCIMNQY